MKTVRDVFGNVKVKDQHAASPKGISLPVNAIVVIALAAVVLVAVFAFFAPTTVRQISKADAQRIYATGCQRYCSSDAAENYNIAAGLPATDPEFIDACTQLGYSTAAFPNRCLEACPCDLSVSEAEARQRENSIIQKLQPGNFPV